MTKKNPVNIAASVRQRLLNLSKERGEDYQSVITRYVLERLLYRVGRSTKGDEFVLKGAMLFSLWTGTPHRMTWDLDLLGKGDPEPARIKIIFEEICGMDVTEDGVQFDDSSIKAEQIKEDDEYLGVRVRLEARIEAAKIPIQVDIGFGDVITPPPVRISYPVLLEFPAPTLRSYPRETVIAEKLEAMVSRGMTNSRMKDFYDIWVLAGRFDYSGHLLQKAILSTFKRRGTPVPTGDPVAFTHEFHSDSSRQGQWRAFLKKGRLEGSDVELSEIVPLIRDFLSPILSAISQGRGFEGDWKAGGPWT